MFWGRWHDRVRHPGCGARTGQTIREPCRAFDRALQRERQGNAYRVFAIGRIKSELEYYRALAADPSVPAVSRWLLLGAVSYLVTPIDLIPDFIPLIGFLDDLILVPAAIWLAMCLIPPETKQRIRRELATRARRLP